MNNKTETNQPIWRFEDLDIFLKSLFKSAKPQTDADIFLKSLFKSAKPQADAMTENQKRERFLKAIMDLGKTNQEK